MNNIRFSNEMVVVLLVITAAILFSIVVFIRQNPALTLAIIGAVVLYKNRNKIRWGKKTDIERTQ